MLKVINLSKMKTLLAIPNLLKNQLNVNSGYNILLLRKISLTNSLNLDQQWRDKEGLPKNPNAEGPLVDSPDYSFLDGRPVPLGSRQKKRVLQQREMAAKVVQYIGEVNFAKERYQKIINKKPSVDSPLKSKGHALLINKA